MVSAKKNASKREQEVVQFYGWALEHARDLHEYALLARQRTGNEPDDIYHLDDQIYVVHRNMGIMLRNHGAAAMGERPKEDPFVDLDFITALEGRDDIRSLSDSVHNALTVWAFEIDGIIQDLRTRRSEAGNQIAAERHDDDGTREEED